MLEELKSKDIKALKEKWHNEQNNICPILREKIDLKYMTLDHQHKLKREDPDETGKGICRGAIEFRANGLEGKITNNFKRYGLDKIIELPEFLRNLADYLEENHIQDEIKYVHPSEQPKPKKIKKQCYNKLKKKYTGKRKFPDYPKSQKLTKKLSELFKTYDIEIEYYK